MKNYKDLVREKVKLTELIEHFGQGIKKKRVDCPLCGGNDAYLNPKTNCNTVKCFNCGKYYNLFDWVMITLQLPFKEALDYLLNYAGIDKSSINYSHMIQELSFKKKEKKKNEQLCMDSESNLIRINRLIDTSEEQGLHSDITEEMSVDYRSALIKHRKLKKRLIKSQS